jgi:xanthine dehydrogenase small subunit
MQSTISFILDNRITTIDFSKPDSSSPTTTVLNYLRSLPNHKGVKEGCAEGDCGACTVVLADCGPDGNLRYRAVNSCLVFLPMIHGKQLITVENLKSEKGELHPVQKALVEAHGTQCGFCTPGIVMSLFALYKNQPKANYGEILNALSGNLCRCTGYQPIIEAGKKIYLPKVEDQFDRNSEALKKMLDSVPKDGITIKTDRQKYFQPVNLKEALKLRAKYPQAYLLSGATDIALKVTKDFETLGEIIDLSAVPELQGFYQDDDYLYLGTSADISFLLPVVQTYLPALADMFSVYGSLQIRNLATLGGNLGTASPIGDTLPVLMAYQASVLLEGVNGSREIGLDKFFKSYRLTDLKPDEIITHIKIPIVTNGAIVRSYKISKRRDLDISTVSSGFCLQLNGKGETKEIILAFGGMADRVKRAVSAENYLYGKSWERNTVEEAMKLIDQDFSPISDVRGSAEFRRVAAKNLLLKFWNETHNEM